MYRVMVEDELGNTVADTESDCIVLVANTGAGISATSLVDAPLETIFQIALTMDITREQLIRRSPILRLMYKFRKKFVKGVSRVDISMLREALRRRMEDDDEE